MTRPRRILALALTIMLYVLLAPVVIMYALGFRVYQKPLHLERTGLVLVRTTANPINAYIDSQASEKSSSPIRFAFLRPGPHRIFLTRKDLLPWSATVSVGSGEAVRVSPASLYSLPNTLPIPANLLYDCRAGDTLVFHELTASDPTTPSKFEPTKTILVRNRQTYSIARNLTCLSGSVIGLSSTKEVPAVSADGSLPQMTLGVYDFPPLFGDGTLRTTSFPSDKIVTRIEKSSSGDVVFQTSDTAIWLWTSSTEPKKLLQNGLPSWALSGRSILLWDLKSLISAPLDGSASQTIPWASISSAAPASLEDIHTISQDDGLVLYGPWGHAIVRDGAISSSDANGAETVGYRHQTLQPIVWWTQHNQTLSITIGGDTMSFDLEQGATVIDVDATNLVCIVRKTDGIGFVSLAPSIRGVQTSIWTVEPDQIVDTVSWDTGVAALLRSSSNTDSNDAKRVPQWFMTTEASAL